MQPMSLDNLPVPTGPLDGLFLQLPNTIDARSFSGQIRFDYTHDPLIAELVGGAEPVRVSIVEHRLLATLTLAYGLAEGLMVYASLPAALYQTGDEPNGVPVDTATGALGDLTLGINARLYGADLGFSLGLGIALVQPTGDEDSFMSDGRIGGTTTLRAAWNERRWGVAAHAGVSLRPTRVWVTHRSGSDLFAALGAFVWITNEVRVGLELAGVTGLTDRTFADASRSSLEVALSGRAKLTRVLFIQGGASVALIEAVGTPDVRGTVAVGLRTDGGL